MAFFVIAMALFLVSGEASASIADHCTDISYYDVIKYEKSTKQCCDTKLHLVCTTKSDQVCQDVLELQCDVVAWGECISTPTYTPGTKCSVKFNDFAHQNCEEVTASVAHTKKMPECKEVTKNNCVTDWEVDDNGNKVWAGTETCTPVTWEECEIVAKKVEFPSVKTECHVDSHIKWAEFIDATTNIVGLESKCEVKKAINCKKVVVNKCAPVVWEECKMEPREECLAKVIHTPSQEKIHKKKCLTGEVSWTAPVKACIWESNVEIVNDVTLKECQEKCDSTTAFPCRSVQWSDSGLFAKTCWMSNVIRADTNKYQRPCTGIFSNLRFSERIEDSINQVLQPFQNPFVYWSCEFCSEASSALVSHTTSTSFLQDETELLVPKLCPRHPDPDFCKKFLPTFWAGYGKAIWSGFWALICLDQDCSSNDGVPEFWYRVAESKTLATCSDCRERIKTHLDRLDGVTALNKYRRKLPKFCEYQRKLPEFLDVEECNELGEWLDRSDFHTFLKEKYRQNEDWITDICQLNLDCIGPSSPPDLHVSVDGTLTTSPLPLGSNATVTCQSTGGHPEQTLTLSKNQEPLRSSPQHQINHTFTVVQDDHEAVFRCEVLYQTRTDPQVAELTLEVHLPCSAWTWNEWSDCSQTCGRGNKTRTRTPDKNGIFTGCEVELKQRQWCNNIEDCPRGNCSEWQWADWTCSVTCGNGVQIRQRKMDFDTYRKYKGCEVERIQLENCIMNDCPRCDGKKDCCTPCNPCGEGDGHCDEDRDCKPGLVCGDPKNPEDKSCRRPIGRCEGIFCLHELPTNRRCTEGHDASGKTTTYNWYDDKWPAQGHTAQSCKYLCQQDPTCPQASFYDRGDCYVYTTSTGPGVNVGGCAIVGCIPKEMYFKCEEEQGLDDGHCDEDSDCKPGLICGEANRCTRPEGHCSGKRSAVTNTPTEDQDLYKLGRKVETTLHPNEEKRQPVDSAIELESNIIPYFFSQKFNTPDKHKDVYRKKMKEIEKETNKGFIFQEEKVFSKCETIRCLEIATKSEAEIESYSEAVSNTDLCCKGLVTRTKNVVERVLLISFSQRCPIESDQCEAFILHELMHVLEVGHTFTRSDRDENINVVQDNVNKLGLQNLFTTCEKDCPRDDEFRKCKEEHCPLESLESGITYDCESIMHYGTHANGEQLMEPEENCKGKLEEVPKLNPSAADWTLLKEMSKIEGPWSPVKCPTGWIKKKTGCYEFVESTNAKTGAVESMTATMGADKCTFHGGYLAEINSEEEQEEVWAMYQIESSRETLDAIWIGGRYVAEEDKWLDLSGKELKYKNWKNEPNGGTRGKCIAFSLDGKWNNAPCSSIKSKALCEYAGIIQSVRALGGFLQHMSFELDKKVAWSSELTDNENLLIEKMKEVKDYFKKSCHTQNSCESKEISKFASDLRSRYEEIDKIGSIGSNFETSFIKEKEILQKSIFTSESFLKQEPVQVWVKHDGLNCYQGNGGDPLQPDEGGDPLQPISLSRCMEACRVNPNCQGVIRKTSDEQSDGICYLRKNLQLQSCVKDSQMTLHKKSKVCTTTCDADEICVEDKCQKEICIGDTCMKKCPMSDLKTFGISGYSWIMADCYCPANRGGAANRGGVCPKQSRSNCEGGNLCEINYGCMLNVCPYIGGIPWPYIIG